MFGVIARPRVRRGRHGAPSGLSARHVGALVGLALVLLLLDDLPVVHDHAKPGLYNEECPLARLAAGGPRAFRSSSPDPMVLLRAPEALPVAPHAAPAQVSPPSFDPRAPPAGPLLPFRALIG